MGMTSIKRELKDFLDGKIAEVTKNPGPGPGWSLVDENGKLTQQGLDIAMYHPLKKGLQKILISSLNTDLVVKTPHSKVEPFNRMMRLLQLVDDKNRLTRRGYYKALGCLPIEKQCEALNIEFETIPLRKKNKSVEVDVFNHYASMGWQGTYDEGQTLRWILLASCSDQLAELAPIHAEHHVQSMAEFTLAKIKSEIETNCTVLEKLIEIKKNGQYDFKDIYSKWKDASKNITNWYDSKALAIADDKLAYVKWDFIDAIKEMTGVKDEFLLDALMSKICRIEEKSEISKDTTLTVEDLEKELAKEKNSLEDKIQYSMLTWSWYEFIFSWLGYDHSLSLAFPPGGAHKAEKETKIKLLNAIKEVSESKLMDNITSIRRSYDEHHDPNAPSYISLESIKRVYSRIRVSKILRLAEEYFDGRLGLNGWPDLTLIKDDNISLIEVKIKDKLHYNQVRTFSALRNIFKNIKVVKVDRS